MQMRYRESNGCICESMAKEVSLNGAISGLNAGSVLYPNQPRTDWITSWAVAPASQHCAGSCGTDWSIVGSSARNTARPLWNWCE